MIEHSQWTPAVSSASPLSTCMLTMLQTVTSWIYGWIHCFLCTVLSSSKLQSSDRSREFWRNNDHVGRVIALCKHATIEIHCNQHEFTLTTGVVPHKGPNYTFLTALQEMSDTKKVEYGLSIPCRPTTEAYTSPRPKQIKRKIRSNCTH